MKGEQLLDALGQLPDSIIEDTDALRRAPLRRKYRPWPLLAAVACLCLVMGALLHALPPVSPGEANGSGSGNGGTVSNGAPPWDGASDPVTGANLLYDQFHLDQGWTQAQIQAPQWENPVPLTSTQEVEALLESLADALFVPVEETSLRNETSLYTLSLTSLEGDTLVLTLYTGGYVTAPQYPHLCLQVDPQTFDTLVNTWKEVSP